MGWPWVPGGGHLAGTGERVWRVLAGSGEVQIRPISASPTWGAQGVILEALGLGLTSTEAQEAQPVKKGHLGGVLAGGRFRVLRTIWSLPDIDLTGTTTWSWPITDLS